MQNNGQKSLAGAIFLFFRETAKNPFLAFLVLLAMDALVAGLLFFNFYQLYSASDIQGLSAPGGAFFTEAKAAEYRRIFTVIEEREKEYGNPAIPAVQP
ncbi:MAG: hypothetical protein MUD10_04750 [Candidatus Pacebacteria bacterium]|jgi:hypothetical protein|nr:hypothetical protein [Candidatus Paceibacterota bacterium]